MKAMVLTGRECLELRDVPEPEIQPDSVLVEVEACAICNATDARIKDADDPTTVWPNQPWPFVMGHEICGTVLDVGPELVEWSKGDRIAGWCEPFGGFAERCLVHPDNTATVKVPHDMPGETACLLELAIGTTRYLMNEDVRPRLRDARAAYITGLGPSGLLYLLECRCLGIENVYVSGRHKQRQDMALRFGATEVFAPEDDPASILAGRGVKVDVAIDTTGSNLASDFLKLLRPGGVVVPFGVGWDWDDARESFKKNNIAIADGALDEARTGAPLVMDWIATGAMPLGDIVTTTLPLADLAEGFDILARREAIKVVVVP